MTGLDPFQDFFVIQIPKAKQKMKQRKRIYQTILTSGKKLRLEEMPIGVTIIKRL
jgi:hypothetical protein